MVSDDDPRPRPRRRPDPASGEHRARPRPPRPAEPRDPGPRNPGPRDPGPRDPDTRPARSRADRPRGADGRPRRSTSRSREDAAPPRRAPRRPAADQQARPRRSDARGVDPRRNRTETAQPADTASAQSGTTGAAVLRTLRSHPTQVVVAVLSAFVLIITGFAWKSVDGLRSNLAVAAGLGLGGAEDGAIDILIVGVDSRTDAKGRVLSDAELELLRAGEVDTTSTDTIMLIRIPTDGSSATAVSIPRDTYTAVPGIGKVKINSAYGSTRAAVLEEQVEAGVDRDTAEAEATEAGRQALITAVGDLTGVTVDHFAEVGLLGFVLLTDAVDGVEVCLNAPVDEPLSGARFDAGPQRLGGADALSFVRQRQQLPRGDLDRIVRQQVYLASLTRQVLSAGTLSNPTRLGRLGTAIERSVVIDDGWDIIEFAQQMQSLSGGAVRFETIPVIDPSSMTEDGESVVLVDPLEVESFFAELAGREPSEEARRAREEKVAAIDIDPGAVTVVVSNAGPVNGLGAEVAGELESVGYQIGEVGTLLEPYGASTVLVSPADPAPGRAVARGLGGLPVRTVDDLPAGTVEVVLTGDYAGPGTGLNELPVTDGTAAIEPAPAPGPGDAGADAPGDGPVDPDAITAGGDGPMCVN